MFLEQLVQILIDYHEYCVYVYYGLDKHEYFVCVCVYIMVMVSMSAAQMRCISH